MRSAEDFRKARERLKITQREMAEALGVARNYVYLIETGRMPVSKKLDTALTRVLAAYDGQQTISGDIHVQGNSAPVAIQSPGAMSAGKNGEESTAEALARLEARVDGLSDQLSTIQGLLLKLLNRGGE